jgi:Flp pilus assembly protein TadD
MQKSDASHTFHASATDRQRFQVHLDFGQLFEAQGEFDRAVIEYQDALTVAETKGHGTFTPADRALAHRRIASASDRLGRFDQADIHYKKALKLGPKDPKIWNDVGYSYYLQGMWSDAEQAFKTAMKLAPDDARIRTNLGLTLAASGRSQEALSLLSRSEGDAAGHANLGYSLAASGQPELARPHYQKALAMRPDLEVARRALAQLDGPQPGPVKVRSTLSSQIPTVAKGLADPQVTPTATSGTEETSSTPLPLPFPPLPGRTLP